MYKVKENVIQYYSYCSSFFIFRTVIDTSGICSQPDKNVPFLHASFFGSLLKTTLHNSTIWLLVSNTSIDTCFLASSGYFILSSLNRVNCCCWMKEGRERRNEKYHKKRCQLVSGSIVSSFLWFVPVSLSVRRPERKVISEQLHYERRVFIGIFI